jgi:hypothetical protein
MVAFFQDVKITYSPVYTNLRGYRLEGLQGDYNVRVVALDQFSEHYPLHQLSNGPIKGFYLSQQPPLRPDLGWFSLTEFRAEATCSITVPLNDIVYANDHASRQRLWAQGCNLRVKLRGDEWGPWMAEK